MNLKKNFESEIPKISLFFFGKIIRKFYIFITHLYIYNI